MKNPIVVPALALLLLVAGAWWSRSLSDTDSNLISNNGIHWHPQLTIFVNGEEQEIPHNIGLAGVHSPIHTHEDLPIIHLEFSGRVTKDDIRLGKFFEIWGRDMREFGSNMRMNVNGEDNTEYERYELQDNDKIILTYE